MARTIEQEIQFCHGMSDEYKDLEKNHTHEVHKKAFRDYAEEYSQIAKWLEELVTLRKALDKACEVIANYCEKSDTGCKYCPFSGCNGLGCEKDIHLSLDDTFDCDMQEWWKEALIKEVSE